MILKQSRFTANQVNSLHPFVLHTHPVDRPLNYQHLHPLSQPLNRYFTTTVFQISSLERPTIHSHGLFTYSDLKFVQYSAVVTRKI